mgnify:CR=1 FL=1
MGYSIDWSDLEQRIQDQKAALLDTSQNMDPERLKFLVETYDECKGESVFITRAKLFEKVLNNKKIYLDGNPIVGSLAGGRAMIYAYPEWQCNWVKDDLDSEKLALSSLGEVRFSDETKEILKKVYKTWKGKTTYDRANKLYKELYGGNAELPHDGLVGETGTSTLGSGWHPPDEVPAHQRYLPTGTAPCLRAKVCLPGRAGERNSKGHAGVVSADAGDSLRAHPGRADDLEAVRAAG